MRKVRSGWNLLGLNIILCLLFGGLAMAQDHSGHSSDQSKGKQALTQNKTPVVAENQRDVPKVEISAEQQKLIGVKTVQVTLRPLQKVISTVGKVEADERNLATINAKIEGWIEKLYADVTGSYVKKGDPLVEIYSPELVASQRELLLALKWAKQSAEPTQSTSADINRMLARDAGANLDAARQRLLLWDISEGQIKKIEETGKPVRTLTLYSPVSGFVTQKMVISGMKVMPGEKIFDIVDFSSLWVIADIYEYELPLIKVGQIAVITLPYLPGSSISSHIDYIYPTISADTRTAKIRLKLNNAGYKLKPQMFANVEIKINAGNKLLIPESAVIDTGRGIVAYVDAGDGSFEPREIKAGLQSDGSIEVLEGLKAGERVVSQANFLIDSEAQLKGIKPLPNK
jgi:membrane fusion protein, copper/silver efflux system